MLTLLRWILIPFSLLYGICVWLRNLLYDWGILRQTSFKKPVMVVGNLAIGGTGKSPMTIWLLQLLEKHYRVASLSRGYGRKTTGFREVNISDIATQVGDEPLQLKHKMPHLQVAVSEDRVKGLEQIIDQADVFVLDDAYQHRALIPGFSMLLFDFQQSLKPVLTLPTGDYRDVWSARRRADAMIITKTPAHATEEVKNRIRRKVGVDGIPLYFASIQYVEPIPVFNDANVMNPFSVPHMILLTGIANPLPLIEFLQPRVDNLHLMRFPDHHLFTKGDILKVLEKINTFPQGQCVVMTTEKDVQRLRTPEWLAMLQSIPLYYQPIQLEFASGDEQMLAKQVLTYCETSLKANAIN
jgi:tetraacyldisaccharide 4'-kinase